MSLEPLSFTTPVVDHQQLADGTDVYAITNPNEDIVTLMIATHTGATYDAHPGASVFAAEMLTRGTKTLSAADFAQAVEHRGCSVRSTADRDAFSINASALLMYSTDVANLAFDALLNPAFDEGEFLQAKEKRTADRLIDLSDPDYLASRAITNVVYKNHPYSLQRDGTLSDIQALSIEAVAEAHQRIKTAKRTIIAAGPLTLSEVLSSHIPAALPAIESADIAPQMAAPYEHRVACFAEKSDALQTSIRIALPCVSFHHKDYPAIQLITQVFGGYTLARLFTILREEKGYTYGAYAYNDVRVFGNATLISTSVGNEYTVDTISTIISELSRLQTERISDEEWTNAQQTILGMFARTNETPQQTASLLWNTIHHGLPRDYFTTHIRQLQQLTPDDVRDVQQKYFNPAYASFGLSGVRSVAEQALAPYITTMFELESEGAE